MIQRLPRVVEGAIMKSKLMGVMAVIALLGLFPSPGQAATLNFDFSFTNTLGTLSGTVTGVIELPSGCTTCAATAVIINTIPAGFTPTLSPLPWDSTTEAGVVAGEDSFTVVGGALTTYSYRVTPNGVTDLIWQFGIDSGPPGDEGALGAVGYDQIVYGPGPVVPAATPLPAALPLFATGLGALGLLGWRRKRKNAAAMAAA
jgi:hypothetical protein